MKTNVSQHDFTEAFRTCRPDNFTYHGQQALFNYFEELEQGAGAEIELDVIAICCEYSEYESLNEFNCDFDNNWSLEDIRDHTQLIEIPDHTDYVDGNRVSVSGSFIIAQF